MLAMRWVKSAIMDNNSFGKLLLAVLAIRPKKQNIYKYKWVLSKNLLGVTTKESGNSRAISVKK